MLAYQNPDHESYHRSRKPGAHRCLGCRKECTYSAGGPWCHPCNVKRMDQISASLNGMVERARFDDAVQKAVRLRDDAYESLIRQRNAILRAAGGKVTATKEQHKREVNHWSHQSHKDGSETYQID